MSRIFLILILVTTLTSSCSRRASDFMDGENILDKDYSTVIYNNCNSDLNDFNIDFVEDVGAYLIFQLEMSNYSKDSLFVANKDLTAAMTRFSGVDTSALEIMNRDELINFLEEEQIKVKKTKKSRTIASAILTGLEVLSIAAGPGGDVGSALIYAAESSVYIADDRNSFQVAELSIEDEINYLEDWVLQETYVLPDETITNDILVSPIDNEGDILFTIAVEDTECQIRYKMRYSE